MNLTPEIKVLSNNQITKIHGDSLKILEKAGIRVDSEKALKIFKKSKLLKIDGKRVYLKPDLVNQCIESSPTSVKVYNKKGNEAFVIGQKNGSSARFGIGVTNPNFQEIKTNKVIPFRREHTRYGTRLGNMLEAYDMVSTLGVPSDSDPEALDLLNLADMYANTDKPLVMLLLSDGIMEKALEFLTEIHGDISTAPFILPYVNPVTPLILNESTTDKMITSIENGLPLVFSNYGMSGGTSPIDAQGTLTLLNAELLAGLVFSQLCRKGSDIILGSLPASFNMSSMLSTYTPPSYLINLACAEMMDSYKIPHCGTSGSGAGWSADINAAGDLWMNNLTSIMGKVGIAPFLGGNFDSKAFSPALTIMGNDIILKSRALYNGLGSSDNEVNLDEIIELGPGGDYLTALSTLNSLSWSGTRFPNIWPPMSFEDWKSKGSPDATKYFVDISIKIYNEAISESDSLINTVREYEKIIDGINR